jgi:hypothetical protein
VILIDRSKQRTFVTCPVDPRRHLPVVENNPSAGQGVAPIRRRRDVAIARVAVPRVAIARVAIARVAIAGVTVARVAVARVTIPLVAVTVTVTVTVTVARGTTHVAIAIFV